MALSRPSGLCRADAGGVGCAVRARAPRIAPMDLSPPGPETAALIAGAGFACAGLWMLLGQRRASGLVVALAGAGLLALAVLRGGGPDPRGGVRAGAGGGGRGRRHAVDGRAAHRGDAGAPAAAAAAARPRRRRRSPSRRRRRSRTTTWRSPTRGEPGTAIVGALAAGDLDYFGFDMPERTARRDRGEPGGAEGATRAHPLRRRRPGLGTAETHADAQRAGGERWCASSIGRASTCWCSPPPRRRSPTSSRSQCARAEGRLRRRASSRAPARSGRGRRRGRSRRPGRSAPPRPC